MKRAAEIFNDKVSLIYEFNKKSPLFVRKASLEIEAGNSEKAIETLTSGLKLYPNYAAAYIILGKAYTELSNFPEALQAYKTGSELIRSSRTYEYYSKEVEALQKQKSLFQHGTSRFFLSEEEFEAHKQPDLFGDIKAEILKEEQEPEKKESKEKPEDKNDHPFNDIESRLEEIAKGLSNVKLSEVNPSGEMENLLSEAFTDENMIVSETLAKIYAAQGEIKEAIQVYRKLIKKNPAKQDYYNEKINELRLQLE